MPEKFEIIFGADSSAYSKAVKSMQSETDKAVKGMSLSFNDVASAIAGLQFADKFIGGVQVFAEFDDNLRKIGATAGATEEELQALEQAALQVGAARPRELEEGLQVLVQQGLKASDAISVLPSVVKLARAENIALADSAGVALGLMNSFGEGVDALPALLDKLLAGSQATAMGVLDYGEAIKQVGSVSGTFGADVNDMLAAVGLTRNAYINAETAGGSLKSAMADLYNPVGQTAEALDVLNKRIGGLGLQVKDAQGNFVGWGSVIEQLEQAGIKGEEMMKLFGKESGPTLAALLQQGSAAIKKLTGDIENSGGAVDKTAEQMESGLGGALRIASSEIEVAAIKLMKELEPALMAVVGAAQYTGEAVDIFVGTAKSAGAGASVLAGAAFDVASAFELVTDAVGLTDNATNSFAENADAAYGSAGDLANQAAISYSGLSGEIDKSKVATAALGGKVDSTLREIADATGLPIASFKEFDELVASGAIRFNNAAGVWINAETGKGAAILDTTKKIEDQGGAVESSTAAAEVYKKSLEEISAATGYTPSAALMQEAADLERNATLWQEHGAAVEEVGAAMYAKLTAMAKEAADQGQSATAASLTAQAEQYQQFAAVTAESVQATADAYTESYKATGAFSDEFFAAEEVKINKRTELLIKGGADAVEAERSAQAEIAALRSSVLDSMASATGYTPSAALMQEAADLERNATLWQEHGAAVEEVGAAMYAKLTAMAKEAADQGQSATAASLTAQAEQYQQFAAAAQSVDVDINVDANTAQASAKIDAIAANETVTIDVDTDTSQAESAITSLQGSVETVAMSTYDYLQQLSSSSMLLNSGETRAQLEQIKDDAIKSTESLRDEQLRLGAESLGELYVIESAAQDRLNAMKLHGNSQAISSAETEFKTAIKNRLNAEEKAQDEMIEMQEELANERKENLKEEAEGRKDAIQDQLDAAREQLDNAKAMQKAYWDDQLDSAESYYDEVKDKAEEAKDAMMEAAKEEFDHAVSLIEQKIKAREDELDSARNQLSALKQIYSESGAGGEEYFRAEADALARRAQEMKDQGIDQVLIEKWLSDELNDLRLKAAEAGVAGLDSYAQGIITSYQQTGEFSAQTANLQSEIEKLKEKLASLREGGYEQFFSEAEYAALGFDTQLQNAQSKIESVKASIAEINGDNFDFTGQSAESMANAVSVAEQQVQSLEGSLRSIEEELKRIAKIETEVSGEIQRSGQGQGGGGMTFFTGESQIPAYDVGGYTGNAAPSSGFLAKLHNDEYIIPDASRFFRNLANTTTSPVAAPSPSGGGGITLNIATVNVNAADAIGSEQFVNAVVKKAIGANNISKLKQDMERHSRRSGL